MLSDQAPQTRRKPRKVNAERLHRIALSYLERYAASTGQIRRVLERRVYKAASAHGEDPAIHQRLIEEEIERLQQAGLVDDALYAEGTVRAQRARGASTRGIAAKLKAKGVGADLISAALEADEADDEAAARRYAERRRLGPYRLKHRAERRDRDLAALCRAGFDLDLARKIIDGGPADSAP